MAAQLQERLISLVKTDEPATEEEKRFTDIVCNLVGDTHASYMRKFWDHVEIVEQEIEDAMEKYPHRAEIIYNMFSNFTDASFEMYEYDTGVFRSHVAEILDRLGRQVNKPEMISATNAELMVALIKLTLKTPITRDATLVYFQTFVAIYGWDYLESVKGMENIRSELPTETWSGAVGEEINRAKKALRRDRKIPTDEELAEKRAEDMQRGNKVAWMKYQDFKPIQFKML